MKADLSIPVNLGYSGTDSLEKTRGNGGSSPRTHPPRVAAVICSTRPIQIVDYFRRLRELLSLQHEYPGEVFFAISDNDSFARNQRPEQRRQGILNAASACLALGLDENKAILYRHSELPQALEFLWSVASIAIKCRGVEIMNSTEPDGDYLPIDDSALFAANGLVVKATIMAGNANQLSGWRYARVLAQVVNGHCSRQVLALPSSRLMEPPSTFAEMPFLRHSAASDLSPFVPNHELEKQFSLLLTEAAANGRSKTGRADSVQLHRPVSSPEYQWCAQPATTAGDEPCSERVLASTFAGYFSTAAAKYAELCQRSDYVWDVLREGACLAGRQADRVLETLRTAIGVA
jgi:tryptophanyl-tRNA synthetase